MNGSMAFTHAHAHAHARERERDAFASTKQCQQMGGMQLKNGLPLLKSTHGFHHRDDKGIAITPIGMCSRSEPMQAAAGASSAPAHIVHAFFLIAAILIFLIICANNSTASLPTRILPLSKAQAKLCRAQDCTVSGSWLCIALGVGRCSHIRADLPKDFTEDTNLHTAAADLS